MPGVEFGLALDDSRIAGLIERGPEMVVHRVGRIVEGAAIDTQREMRIAANVGVTGQLRGSIRYTYSLQTLSARVFAAVSYAEDLEYGTPPHHASVAEGTPLKKWADLKGIEPYALQKSIERKGTQPHPFAKPTFLKMQPVINRQFVTGIEELTQDLNDDL